MKLAKNIAGKATYQYFMHVVLSLGMIVLSSCAHYPVNEPLGKIDPESGYRGKLMGTPGNSDELLLYAAFSGGGTRAAAFSYGALEVLKDTEVTINGRKRRLLDEVDGISGVSGGSFTAGYYGLFGDRIFADFESKFLKKNVQGAIVRRIFLNPFNWLRLFSPAFDRSDLAAEYYDKHIFEGGTFGDIARRKGPIIIINGTDMITGIRMGFNQDAFDVICSDISNMKVARAVAASSAVPILLTPVTLKNYAGGCGFKLPEAMQRVLTEQDISSRQFQQVNNVRPYLDAKKTPYIHLVDGGVSDNLGLRAVLDRVLSFGSVWETLKYLRQEKVHKIVFISVNAETEVNRKWLLFDKPPAFGAMLTSYASIAITRYNYETIMLLRESFPRWTEEIQKGRCGDGPISTEPGACGDIKFYLIEVKFDALKDEDERTYFKQLPTSFKLSEEQVDKLKEAAHRILRDSPDFRRFLDDLQ